MNPYQLGINRAKALRGEWQLGSGPIGDIFGLLEEHGIDVVRWPMDRRISGCLAKVPEVGPIIFINNRFTLGHQAFTAAHELYHLVSDQTQTVRWEVLTKEDGPKPDVERAADAFAAEFLMPPPGIVAALGGMAIRSIDVEHVIRLQILFGVSYVSMTYRLHNLKIINKRKLNRLLEERYPARRALELGYDARIVFGDPQPIYPRRFRRLALRALLNGDISRAKFKELLEISETEFDRMVKEAQLEELLVEGDDLPLNEP